jgi:hypothetical protein
MNTISKLAIAGAFLASGIGGVSAQTQPSPTPSTVDPPAQQQNQQQPQAPKTTGAMDKAVTGIATSPDDVKRQTEGQPTAADEAKGATATAPKPGMTNNPPGTVGAAPGVQPGAGQKSQ